VRKIRIVTYNGGGISDRYFEYPGAFALVLWPSSHEFRNYIRELTKKT